MFPTDELVAWPVGKATHETPAYAATIAVTVKNRFTIIEPAQLTGGATLDLTIDPEMTEGAIVALKIKASTNGYDLTLGAGINGPAIVGVAGKTNSQSFYYDGTNFIPMGAYAQVD